MKGVDAMALMNAEYRDRLNYFFKLLRTEMYIPLETLSLEGFETEEHLTREQALSHAFQPIPEGHAWGHAYSYMWMKSTLRIPREARGERICMDLNPGGEATLFVNGEPFGTRRAGWVLNRHHMIEDNVLLEKAEGGETLELLMEVYAGHDYAEDGACATGPVLPHTYDHLNEACPRTKVEHNTFGIWQEDAYQLYMDMQALSQIMTLEGENSLRAADIAQGLEDVMCLVDFEQERPLRLKDYQAARACLKPLMDCKNGSTVPVMSAVGNSHLDLVWLWPIGETRRKTARTFAAQLRLLDEYPDYVYIQSQPASYEMCREYYPDLYEKIRKAIREGRWIADGAMYVEPDTNMPSGEALVRQLLLGIRYYREQLGTEPKVLWLPDTFGYSAALPQLLSQAGIPYMVTQKIFWSYNEGDPFPYHYFHWKGMDGTQVISFLPTSYTYRIDPKNMEETWNKRVQKRKLHDFLIPFGYGDGGGGPCRDDLEMARRMKDLEGSPKIEMKSPARFFEELDEKGGPDYTWDGELYFDAHRGTYTTQALLKKNNRRSEFCLHNLEALSTFAALYGQAYPAEDLDRMWKTLLLNQFHDILPGSSIGPVYVMANGMHAELQAEAEKGIHRALNTLVREDGDALTLFNPLGVERTELIPLPDAFRNGAQTGEGTVLPLRDGQVLITLMPFQAQTLRPATALSDTDPVHAREEKECFVLESPRVRALVDRNAQVLSMTVDGREIADSAMNVFTMYQDIPRVFDAWDVDSNYRDMPRQFLQVTDIHVGTSQGLSASLVWEGTIGHSRICQTISLNAASTALTFDTTIDWHELHRLLKVAFPVDVRTRSAMHEIQFGYVERPNHRNRNTDAQQFEVCQHRYSALMDHSHGAALLNDCKYGIGVEGQSMELTLLRAAASPDFQADQGTHALRYALLPWDGSWLDARITEQAMAFNNPVITVPGSLRADLPMLRTDRSHVIPDTLKMAEDGSGDVIVRLYECARADDTFRLVTDLKVDKAWRCSILEDIQEEVDLSQPMPIRAFEVLTLRLRLMKD